MSGFHSCCQYSKFIRAWNRRWECTSIAHFLAGLLRIEDPVRFPIAATECRWMHVKISELLCFEEGKDSWLWQCIITTIDPLDLICFYCCPFYIHLKNTNKDENQSQLSNSDTNRSPWKPFVSPKIFWR